MTPGARDSLESATSSPPPRHTFTSIPRIRSERPAFEHHYPHLLERLEAEAHAGPRRKPADRGAALAGAAIFGASGTRQGSADPDPGNGDRGSGDASNRQAK